MSDAQLELASARERMISQQLMRRGIADPRVLDAMREVPREAFVSSGDRARAYSDNALALGSGQTISQPYMVARALQLAELGEASVALDVGLGSGYQAAVLSRLCARVVGIELLPELADAARRRLKQLGFDNVEVITGDGSAGWAPQAPYDAILVAAAAARAPKALLEQLRVGGKLVIPIGTRTLQTLTVITRGRDGFESVAHDACVYVPLIGADQP